jgi:lipopolysaccharide export LptBFGC system permease protein LptF
MKTIICLLIFASTAFGFVNLNRPKIKSGDFKRLTNGQWKGKLTYQDYRSNKKVSILSNLTVTESSEDKSSWIFEYEYPDEPKANEKSIVKISKDGKTFDDETVIERTKLPNGTLKIVTTKNGTDNDKPAVFRYIYLINKTTFSIKKEVKYEGTDEFFERNEYSWNR